MTDDANSMNGTRGVLVTGCSTGIGAASARLLDAAGFRVFAGVRKLADADTLRASTSEMLTPVVLDVTDSASVEAAAQAVEQAVGATGLWGLVNNAGICLAGPCELVTMEDLRRQFDVNFFGLAELTQRMLGTLRSAQGRVVNISSISGLTSLPMLSPYCASKFAVEAYSDALRVELRPWHMRVVLVEPGAVQSEIWGKTMSEGQRLLGRQDDDAKARYAEMARGVQQLGRESAKRAIPAEKVARVVLRALTTRRPRARYLVGLDTRVHLWLNRLPTPILDWLMYRLLTRGG